MPNADATPTLRVRLAHRFDARFELNVSLDVGPGVTVLQGPSGSGKTSTLHAIAGLWRPSGGEVSFGAERWHDERTFVAPHHRGVALVFQTLALFPHLSARDNVRFASRSRPLAEAWLERMRVSHLADRKPASFSRGEAQRVALARAFARQPRVLLLDEPFAALDDTLRTELWHEVETHVTSLGLPTLLVTHDQRDAPQARGDGRVVSLRDGRQEH